MTTPTKSPAHDSAPAVASDVPDTSTHSNPATTTPTATTPPTAAPSAEPPSAVAASAEASTTTTKETSAVAGGAEAASVAKKGEEVDEDCSKEYEPVVRLAEVETKTGEEDEEVLFKIRAKLFRFSQELSEWKERGTGDIRILEHAKTRKIRLLMRREKTLKICLNHYVNPDVELGENVGSDRSWVWPGVDYADGERDEAMLAIRFRDSDNANLFKKAYDDARDHMAKLKSGDLPSKD